MDWPFSSLTRAKPSRCLLLELPPEIRNAIYELACTSDKTVVTFRLDSYQCDSYDEAVLPKLAMVNRQVREESIPVYFACNKIAFHTEGSKKDDGRRWLYCNESHLSKLRDVTLWIRYVSLANDRSASHGALGISLHRSPSDDRWQVNSKWDWITVMRKPNTLDSDANFLIQQLAALLAQRRTACTSAEGFADMMTDLRMLYVREKIAR